MDQFDCKWTTRDIFFLRHTERFYMLGQRIGVTLFRVGHVVSLSLYKPSPYSTICFHSNPLPLQGQCEDFSVIIHQSPQTQLSHQSSIQTSTMERRLTYEAIKADPSTLVPRNRTASDASASSSSSSSSSSSTSLSRRKLIRDRYKRPWQLMSVITLHQEEVPVGRSGGLKSPYPTPGRRNYDRV